MVVIKVARMGRHRSESSIASSRPNRDRSETAAMGSGAANSGAGSETRENKAESRLFADSVLSSRC